MPAARGLGEAAGVRLGELGPRAGWRPRVGSGVEERWWQNPGASGVGTGKVAALGPDGGRDSWGV